MKIALVFEDHDEIMAGAEGVIEEEIQNSGRNDIEIECFLYSLDFLEYADKDTALICYNNESLQMPKKEFMDISKWKCPKASYEHVAGAKDLKRLHRVIRANFA